MKDYLCIRLNPKFDFKDRTGRIGALSQMDEFNFNSACMFNGKVLGANEDGIFILDSGATFAGTAIAAYFKTVTTDFGEYRQKHVRKVIVAGEGDGGMTVTTYNKDGNARAYPFDFAGNLQSGVKVPVGRDGLSRYWSFKVANVAGSDFSIDEIDALTITT